MKISRISVENLPESGLDLHFEEDHGLFQGLVELSDSGEWRFAGPIRFDLHLQPIEGLIPVDGSLATMVEADCSRCLTAFRMPLQARFRFTYTRRADVDGDGHARSELELTPEETGLIAFEGDEIDLTDALQEEIIMALPMRPLCGADCKGLCPQCGANRNLGDCGCRQKSVNPTFEALKGLKIIKK